MARKHVVVIEDCPHEQLLTVRALRNHILSPDCQTISGGEEAIEHFRNSKVIPDLVLVDIKMPKVTGIDVVKQVTQFPHLEGVPFVMMTKSTMKRDIEDAYAAGACSYLVKHESSTKWMKELNATLHYWLHMNVNQRSTNVA